MLSALFSVTRASDFECFNESCSYLSAIPIRIRTVLRFLYIVPNTTTAKSAHPAAMAPQENVRSFHHDVTDEKAGALQTEEIVVQRITDEDLLRISRDAMPRFWTKTGFRICLIIFLQGCNQAGYGVDWAVISEYSCLTNSLLISNTNHHVSKGGINAYPAWHKFFGIAVDGGKYEGIV